MDSRNTPMGDGAPDWNDMSMSMFDTSQFDESMPAESPYGNSAFNDFTNLDAYSDSPIGLSLRAPSKSGPNGAASAGAHNPQGAQMMNSASAESSSQDSSSDSSSRRKRKTNESESPISDPVTETGSRTAHVKKEDVMVMGDTQQMRSFDQNFSQPMHNLSLEQSLSRGDSNMSQFDFNSAASSPIQTGDFNSAMSLDAHVNMPASTVAAQFNQDSPVQTINPGMFAIGGSRDQSPATNNMMFNQASPNAIFSTPSSDSQEGFGNNQTWNPSLSQNPAWPNEFTNQLTSPGGIAFTPSPVPNGGTPGAVASCGAPSRLGRSPLHIAPISTKSRVETQINVIMTLEKPPPGIDHLHLPLHTIAKSKLLAKEEFEMSKVLELHTMLVCSSAMHNPQFKEKALQRAAAANNDEIQRRAGLLRESGDDDKNDPKNLDEADKPSNGGEVRICSNCIQRERKRAGRKKTKREEEQQHWERFETERVVVFNSNEYLPFKLCEPGQHPARDPGMMDGDQYTPPDGAVHVTAAMRIACYCRHQSEKEGFQVIFTLKDQHGNVIAQQMSDSILITDDHKTHPQSFSTAVAGEGFYQNTAFLPNGLPMSYSMVDIPSHVPQFTSSRSAGNLQALAYGAQFNPHSHVHQLPGAGSGYASQTTSATMTPTSLSRPGSPTGAGQVGPNKKRKSSSFHRKVPSGLTMTPRVDTSQSPSSNMPSALSMNSQFSPASAGFPNQMNQSYMTIPNNNGPAQYFGSGPPTPNESGPFNFSQPQVDLSRISNNQAYFSHPSSAVPSRASSPVLQQTRANMAAYARQQPIQTPTNSINARPAMFAGQAAPGSAGHDGHQGQFPMISRITPTEGPTSGGNEVAVFGENFTIGMQVTFGEQDAATQFLSPTSLIATAPPGRMGSVNLGIHAPPGQGQYPIQPGRPIYRYTQNTEEMMVMALKFLSEQHYGNVEAWQSFAQQSATNFIQSRVGRAGLQQQGYSGGNRMAAEPAAMEEMILNIIDAVDMSESPRSPNYDLASKTSGATLLSLACSLGMHRVAAALMARGANVEARDRGGYTPLMHAALQGVLKLFQLLIARGADPIVRSLTGYAAVDLAPAELRDDLIQIVLSTKRRRHSRQYFPSRLSYGSAGSSKASWDVASASFYESEVDSSERRTASQAPSRRLSAQSLPEGDVLPEDPPLLPTCAAMVAWRDTLAVQINRFQETVHWNMPHFQLPPLPNLTDYRRLGHFVPGRIVPAPTQTPPPPIRSPQPVRQLWDRLSASTSTSAPDSAPPAYHDIFPERNRKPTEDDRALKDAAVTTAMVDAVADEKCAIMFEQSSETSLTTSAAPVDGTQQPNKAGGALISSRLWISILVIITSIVMHLLMPYISEMPAHKLGSFSTQALTA